MVPPRLIIWICADPRPNSAVEFSHTRASQKKTIGFDADGVCDACLFAEKKKTTIDWGERERQLNRLIAELKMVRMLQLRVNRDTKDVDKKRLADAKDLPAILMRRIESLQGRQEDVHDVTERIAVERGDELQQ